MTKEITIQGLSFTVATPYAEGHVVTEAEAKALNQTRSEAVRNNMASVVKAAKGEDETVADMDALIAAVAEYDAAYQFTLASVGGGRKTTDPVEAEALRLARSAITAQLKAAGRKVKDYDKDVLDGAIAKLADTDDVKKAAVKNVKANQALAEAALSALDI
jgi:hypothetical protein